ncbi:MAG: SAM-dependent methyltransferase, partial [Flavobacteriia bacterium]|nr:SAM-dependent methyltransferase [Flavobacteriia bacterium]
MNRPGQNLLSRLNFSDHKKGVSLPLKSDYSTKTILSLLSQLKNGYLKMTLPNGQVREFGDKASSLQADIQIFDWNVFKGLMSHGDIGFAESYIRGDWDSSNLKTILELAIRNRTILDKAIYGTWLGSIFYRVKHWLRDNSKSGSRKNIHAHYDLGNAFYSLWLDPSMSYSSAWFSEGTKQALGDAQKAKIQRILSCLETYPGDHIL